MRRKNEVGARVLILVLVLGLSLGLSACGGPADPDPEEPEDPAEDLVLTLEELAEFDGKDGRPAYVAVDGVIYDMTDSRHWPGGGHHGYQAGRDLTDVIRNQSPHGVGNLSRVPRVGVLAED